MRFRCCESLVRIRMLLILKLLLIFNFRISWNMRFDFIPSSSFFLLMRRLNKMTNPEVIYNDFNLKKMNVLRIFLLVRKIWITYLFSHYFVHYTNWLITGLHFVSNLIDIEVGRRGREVEEHVCCLYSVSNGFINLRKPEVAHLTGLTDRNYGGREISDGLWPRPSPVLLNLFALTQPPKDALEDVKSLSWSQECLKRRVMPLWKKKKE